MSKQDLIINTIANMQYEEKDLLKKSGRSLGDIVDNTFSDKERAYVQLMNLLYANYDDMEAKDDEKIQKLVADKYSLVKLTDKPLINDEQLKKFNQLMKERPMIPNIQLSKMDLYNFIVRER